MKAMSVKIFRLFVLVIAAVAVIVFAGAVLAQNLGPREILQKTLDRPYQDLVLKVHLVKTSKTGKERPMDITVKMKQTPDVKMTLAVFTAPPEVEGISSLAYDYTDPKKSTDRWFKLSGMDYAKCLGKACQKMEERFGFSTDIFAIDLDEADHKVLGEEAVDGAACYKVESDSKDPADPRGARFITWVDQKMFAARKIEAHDQSGKLTQMSTFTEFKEINGHWWETKGELIQYDSNKKLRFNIEDAKADTNIPDDVFAKPKTFSVQGDEK
ncbi:MAG TPA: outer membrane lipoprotein-sorting protein [bacterium]|nr:outer membrane lipoprotein-sorting protein [bacterium]